MNLIEVFLFVFALIYKIIAWSKKERADQQHYHLMSEIYVVGLVLSILLTQIDNKVSNKEVKIIPAITDTIKH